VEKLGRIREAVSAPRRLTPAELLPWAAVVTTYFLLPSYLPLATQIMVMMLFALSLDLILGYTGIVTLGHAAYYGVGAYTAGILAVSGWAEPITGLLFASAVAALVGLLTGYIILRTSGLALLMLGLAVMLLLQELANHLGWLTGGADGLQGIVMQPLLGAFKFDIYGHAGFVYAALVLFAGWVFSRHLVHSPFGRSLVGIRENPVRMLAIGVPVGARKLIVFTIAAGLAGTAGALSAQTNQFVALNVLSFELSGTVLVILVLGGAGRLYGAFIGAPLYMLAQDSLAKSSPSFWLIWLGLILIGIVMFSRGGALGFVELLRRGLPNIRMPGRSKGHGAAR
jgi:branched-chain amino acid transport system permease protein